MRAGSQPKVIATLYSSFGYFLNTGSTLIPYVPPRFSRSVRCKSPLNMLAIVVISDRLLASFWNGPVKTRLTSLLGSMPFTTRRSTTPAGAWMPTSRADSFRWSAGRLAR